MLSLISAECAPSLLSVCSVSMLFNKTVNALGDFQHPRNQQVAKWIITAKVSQVEKRFYPSSGLSGGTYITFCDNTIEPVKGLKHAAAKLAELADSGRLPQLRLILALLLGTPSGGSIEHDCASPQRRRRSHRFSGQMIISRCLSIPFFVRCILPWMT